jgi:hypothetical protein
MKSIEIEIEIVCNMYRVKVDDVLGPPCFAMLGIIWHGLDREPLIPTSLLAIAMPSKTYT